MDKIVPDDILRLAQHDPIVYRCVMMWRSGGCTWEEAMMLAVKTLAQQSKELHDMLLARMKVGPQIIVFKDPSIYK